MYHREEVSEDRTRKRNRDDSHRHRDDDRGYHNRRDHRNERSKHYPDSDEDIPRRRGQDRRDSDEEHDVRRKTEKHRFSRDEPKDIRSRDHENDDRRQYRDQSPETRNRFHNRNHPRSRHDAPDLASDRGRRNNLDEGRGRGARGSEQELPELYSIHRAKVQSVRPFGVFVRINGFYKQGLVHLSQLSDHEVTDREDSDQKKVQAIAAVAAEGDEVWVKIISLKEEGDNVKIGCSLKLVSQSTGQDLDPGNLKLEQQQTRGNRPEQKKLVLDAIYNVVCSRCGGHGHLKTECYATGDKSYELLPEEDDEIIEPPAEPQQQAPIHSKDLSTVPGYGRGRAMVLPAWMTHGTESGSHHPIGSDVKKKKKLSELPDSVTTVEEALALVAQMKKEKKEKKHHKKEHSKHKKDKKSKSDKSRKNK